MIVNLQNHFLPASHSAQPWTTLWVVIGVTFGVAFLWIFSEPLIQDPLYHNFADERSMLGIPNALDVLSNLVFCFVGIWGCAVTVKRKAVLQEVSVIYLVFFVSLFLIGLGSAYYHWLPDNSSLVWDRLPMTLAFMAFTALVVTERYSESLGYMLLPWLLIGGILSVLYWAWFEDLRPYYAVQFSPMLVLPLIIWKFSGPGTGWLWFTVAFYFLAKLLELSDQQMFLLTEGLVSGHTLKHLAAAAGALMIVGKVADLPQDKLWFRFVRFIIPEHRADERTQTSAVRTALVDGIVVTKRGCRLT